MLPADTYRSYKMNAVMAKYEHDIVLDDEQNYKSPA
jgi:hypothetical protein